MTTNQISAPRYKTILITGASTGIGLKLAQELMRGPYHLILTARKESLFRFQEQGIVEGERLWIRELCVQTSEDQIQVIQEIESKLGGLDVLVNNAGIAYRSVVEHVQEDERLHQMAVNFRGPMALIRLALPRMRERRSGRIINISSVGGMMAMPTMAIYSASKFALEGASEALYYEVKPWGIHVTLVEPGFVNSDGFLKVPYTEESLQSATDINSPYYEHYTNMANFIGMMMRRSPLTPQRIAKKVARIIEHPHPPLRVLATPDAILFDLFRRFLPRRLYHWVLYRSLPNISRWGKK